MATYNYFGDVLQVGGAIKQTLTADVSASSLMGSSLSEKLIGGAGGHTMAGLGGDDTYIVTSALDKIVEQAGQGVDTVQVTGINYYALTENVENLTLLGKVSGAGNDLDNIIRGSVANQTIEGGGGDDVMTGFGGADTFIVSTGSGHDVITDFSALDDRLSLGDYGLTTFAAVQAAMTQDGTDTILHLSDTDAVRLTGVTASAMTEKNFLFSIDTSKLHMTFNDDFNTFSVYDADSKSGNWQVTTKQVALVPQQQVYVDPNSAAVQSVGINPYSVDNGVLTITATPTDEATRNAVGDFDYTSGRITTQNSFVQQYGYFEMRAALPTVQGAWPAFWMLPGDGLPNPLDRELDVVEQIGNGFNYTTAHYATDQVKHSTSFGNYMGDTSGFHTYGMLWTASEIAWYVDGVEVSSMETPADLNRPMYMIALLSVGGGWAGNLDPDSVGALSMDIDYIRAYSVDSDTTAALVNGQDKVAHATPLLTARDGTTKGDKLMGGTTGDHMRGFGGDDILMGGAGNDTLDGGDGNDTVSYANVSQAVQVNLCLGAQDTHGAGVDTLVSVENLTGSAFDDQLIGDGGANKFLGGAGDDRLMGGGGDDSLDGGAGDDLLEGGAGADILNGNAGIDMVTYAHAAKGVQISLLLTSAQDTKGAGIDTLIKVENLTGSDYADTLAGSNAANTLIGAGGADHIYGGGGVDIIIGGADADILSGGAGNDSFVYNLVSDSTLTGFDTITDFKHAADLIDLSGIDANTAMAGNQAFSLIGANNFTQHAGEVRFQSAKDGMHVYGDVNGDGVADFHLLLTGNVKVLDAHDFVL